MASSLMWDVNKYKSEFESEEHWQLRKKFMETHMDKFPEDKLVCLARVFFNVEFLGCRYPEQTMQMIAELSKGVADEHREKQKGKLKRTFVQASDAAGAKIKGTSTEGPEPPKKALSGSSDYCSAHIKFTKPVTYPPDSEEFPGLVIFENCNVRGQVETCPLNILNQSAQKSNYKLTLETIGRKCELRINDKLFVSEEAPTAKEAKLNAAIKGLQKLRKTCYTIQVKRAYFSDGPSITKDSNVEDSESRLPEDNIGSKMMQKMGWLGSGLGKSQQGIADPIKAAPQIMNRAGFGCVNVKDLENKFTKVFKDHIRSNSESDLVFSPDFTPEERKTLHRNESQSDKGDDDSDDLFGSDTEKDSNEDTLVEETSNSQLNQESLCFICSKLRSVTGGETDDYIYDLVWSTGYEKGVLTSIDDCSEEITMEWESTETCTSSTKGDINSEGIAYNQQLGMLEQTEPAVFDEVTTSSVSNEKEPVLEKLKIFLPDGSYKRITLDKILANKDLREFVKFSEEKINMPYRHFATLQDLKTNSSLRELFSDFLSSSQPLKDQCQTPQKHNETCDVTETTDSTQDYSNTLKNISDTIQPAIQLTTNSDLFLLSSRSEPQVNIPEKHNSYDTSKYEGGVFQKYVNTDITFKSITDTLQGEIKPSHPDCSELLNGSSVTSNECNKINVEKEISNTSKYEGEGFQTYRTTDITVKNSVDPASVKIGSMGYCHLMGISKRERNRKVKIFLPDGSFQRLPLRAIECNVELNNILCNRRALTDEDFFNNKIIRDTFFKYWDKISNEGNIREQRMQEIENELSHIKLPKWGINYPETEGFLIGPKENNEAACSHSLKINVVDSEVESINRPMEMQNFTPGSEKESTDLLVPQYLPKRRDKRVRILLPDGTCQRISRGRITRSRELNDIISKTTVLSYTHFINHRIIRETFVKFWDKIDNEERTRLESLIPEVKSNHNNDDVNYPAYETSPTRSREINLAACSNSSEIANEESLAKGIDNPVRKLVCTKDKSVVDDNSGTHQTVTENEFVVDDNSGTHQTVAENEFVSTTNQTPTETHSISLSPEGEFDDSVRNNIKSDNIRKSDILLNNSVCTSTPSQFTRRRRNGRSKVKFFLPDGSFKRVPSVEALKCKELIECVKNIDKRHITVDMLQNENVSRFFSKYLSKDYVDNIIKRC